jgi:hypothetical protein
MIAKAAHMAPVRRGMVHSSTRRIDWARWPDSDHALSGGPCESLGVGRRAGTNFAVARAGINEAMVAGTSQLDHVSPGNVPASELKMHGGQWSGRCGRAGLPGGAAGSCWHTMKSLAELTASVRKWAGKMLASSICNVTAYAATMAIPTRKPVRFIQNRATRCPQVRTFHFIAHPHKSDPYTL